LHSCIAQNSLIAVRADNNGSSLAERFRQLTSMLDKDDFSAVRVAFRWTYSYFSI
jgi:hypothetical protein